MTVVKAVEIPMMQTFEQIVEAPQVKPVVSVSSTLQTTPTAPLGQVAPADVVELVKMTCPCCRGTSRFSLARRCPSIPPSARTIG
eukprot:2355717-Amphidinium_carterae.1